MPRYFYRVDKKCFGPIDVKELKRRFVIGELDQSKTDVMREDGDEWVLAAKLRFKSDPRMKAASLSGKTPSVDLVEVAEEEEEEEEAPAPPSNVPPAATRPMLWNPSLAVYLSFFFFSTAFGAYVHARNWELLNKPKKASTNWIFFLIGIVLLLFRLVCLFLARKNETFAGIAMLMGYVLLLLFIVWYFAIARSLTQYLDARFSKGYRKRSLPISWIAVALGAWLLHFIIGINLLMGLARPYEHYLVTAQSGSLAEARRGFKTSIVGESSSHLPPDQPPAGIFELIRYDSPVGKLSAYLTPDPGNGKKLPAIIWITGGDCNSISSVWEPAPIDNDQTAAAYRNAGIVMMYPSLRGGNDNPGHTEYFLGEVDDVLAAADHLANQSYVDPKRIYLGGHSTGGTLVLLAAECSDRFRAVFSFGPVNDVREYGEFFAPLKSASKEELRLRSPGGWLASIQSPTFLIEGAQSGNAIDLAAMAAACKNPKIQFFIINGGTHFDILAPTNALIAERILEDNGSNFNMTFTKDEFVKRVSSMASADNVNPMPPMPPQFQHPPMMPPPDSIPPMMPSQHQNPSMHMQPPPIPRVTRNLNRFPRSTTQRPQAPPNSQPIPTGTPSPSIKQDELKRPVGVSEDEWIDQLVKDLNEEDGSDRRRMSQLVEALAETNDKRAIEPIVRKVAVYYPNAEQALSPFGEDAERVILKELKTAKDKEYIRRLADALGEVGTKASIQTLKKLTNHPYAFVRIAAEFSINKITRKNFRQR